MLTITDTKNILKKLNIHLKKRPIKNLKKVISIDNSYINYCKNNLKIQVLNSKMQKEIHNTTVIACSVPSIYEYL
jgi:hypothetical protein